MATNARSLERRIEHIKQQLALLGDLRPGSLSEQYNVCGNPACRCKADPPQKHGPYYQLSWTRKRKSRTKFVGRAELANVQAERKNYQRLQELVDEWIDLAIELSDIKLKETKSSS